MPRSRRRIEGTLIGPAGAQVVYLLDAASDYETRILENWVRAETDGARTVRLPSSRRGHPGDPDMLAAVLDGEPDAHLIPLRVLWMAKKPNGPREVSWFAVIPLGDPRDPRWLRARWTAMFRPSRVRLVAGEGATVSELRADYSQKGQVDSLSSYVTRRAWLALDQVERRVRGNRYKIPRFVPEAILSRKEVVEAVDRAAASSGVDPAAARDKAERYLRAIAATHSAYVIDILANLIHKLYSQGYGRIDYAPEDVQKVAELGQGRTLVFLPSHRSNLDRLSLQFMLWQNDLPPNHTAGGINLDFFPVGPLVRRTGVFFIRRTFKDNILYKTVLHAYIDYLVEKRFPLEWYLEGGRSRSGKLLPPRLGLLSYVVDAVRRGKTDEVVLVPVSIAYDQIQDVPDYAREALGKDKEKESIGWLIRAVRSLRRRYGNIYIRFGEPLRIETAAVADDGSEESLEIQKLAFEVMFRIGQATPVTPTALVSVALLAARGQARSVDEVGKVCSDLLRYLETRGIPTTEEIHSDDPLWVGAVLDWLVENKYASSHEAVGRKVYWLDDAQMIGISYYRNMIVHFFVNRALPEIALGVAAERSGDQREEFWSSLLALRDLLKFEFFFPDKDRFLADVGKDLAIDVPGWEQMLRQGGAASILEKLGSRVAYWSLLPFLDAYQIVSDELESLTGDYEERAFLKACLARARMYRIEGRLISGESASQVLFKSALALARNRRLLDRDQDLHLLRAEFAAELRKARLMAAQGL